jgi:serine/threonine protein kinase
MVLLSQCIHRGFVANASALPKPGDVVGGKYRVERLLGMGGMGAVFEGSHRVTDKRFAIKWLLTDAAAAEGGVTRFMREAQVAGRFEHPNVVEVYDIGQEGDAFYMIMELLEGESLAERLTRVTRLPADEARAIVVPCMEGVAAAHAVGIIHRDLKPANVFLCKARGRHAEQPKVLDFGISKISSFGGAPDATLTMSGAVMGTPHYMAPEQMRAQKMDRRVDVYAFGVMLYEVLSGRRPFEANTYADLVLQVMSETPKPLEKLVAGVPLGLASAVSRAMSRDPEARFATLEEFIHTIEAECYVLGTPIGYLANSLRNGAIAPPETPMCSESIGDSRAVQPRSRRLLVWLGAGLASAALVGGSIAMLLMRSAVAVAPKNATETLIRPASEPLMIELGEPHPNTVRIGPELAPVVSLETATQGAAAPVLSKPVDPTPVRVDPQSIVPVGPSRSAKRAPLRNPTPLEPTGGPSAVQLVQTAQHELVEGHLAAAVDLYGQAIRIDPRNEPAWRGLGVTHERLGHTADAVNALQQAIRLSPDGPYAEMLRARLQKLETNSDRTTQDHATE